MSTKAFMLIETETGRAEEVVATLRKYSQIKSVDAVTGPYDVIAVVEQEDISFIGKLVATEIPNINSICCTQVSVCI